jgi:hypothetical protein
MGEKAQARSLLVASHLLTGDLGIHEQPGKQLAKLDLSLGLAQGCGLCMDQAIPSPHSAALRPGPVDGNGAYRHRLR